MSNEIIGRLESLGLGKETTAGTEASSFTYIPLTSVGYIKPVNEYIDNESGIGRIENLSSKEVAKKMSETSIEGRVGQISFGHLMTALFGQSSAAALIETGVYKHAFTVLNSNNHKSYSLVSIGNSQDLSLYNLLDTLSINAETGNVVNFSGMFKGKAVASTSGKTTSFVTEKPFKVAKMEVRFADSVSGLSAASAIPLQNCNFEVSKNVVDVTSTGDFSPVSLHNTTFGITGDMEIIYRNNTYRDYNSNGTTKAMRITIFGENLIGATKYAELNFDFGSLAFTEWDRTNSNDDIVTQTLGFTATYSIAESAMITGYLQNTQSTQY